jgi:hypothetical protein
MREAFIMRVGCVLVLAHRRLLSLQKSNEEKGRHGASKVDEAYQRWTDFNSSVAQRASEATRKRQETLARREAAHQEEAAEKRRALEKRFAEANERRLAHIHMLMQQARVASERSAQAQQYAHRRPPALQTRPRALRAPATSAAMRKSRARPR